MRANACQYERRLSEDAAWLVGHERRNSECMFELANALEGAYVWMPAAAIILSHAKNAVYDLLDRVPTPVYRT